VVVAVDLDEGDDLGARKGLGDGFVVRGDLLAGPAPVGVN
jgi:hypothetical protein